MARKRNSPSEGEWAMLIKAQDEATYQLLHQEKELQRQLKLQYKSELDKQLELKQKLNDKQFNYKDQESSFNKIHQNALKAFDSSKKVQERDLMKHFQLNHQQVIESKLKQQQIELEKDRLIEQAKLRKVDEELKQERISEITARNRRVQTEQEELLKLNSEKIQRAGLLSLEKLKDKEMIQRKIEEMKIEEAKYKEFIGKKMISIEEKIKRFKPYNEQDMQKNDLISRRNAEWEKIDAENERKLAKAHGENKVKVTLTMKNDLERQIDEKQRIKEKQILEEKNYFQVVQEKAKEEERRAHLQRIKKIKEREDLKRVYEKQVEEREQGSAQRLRMDSNEVKIHSELLGELKNKKIIGFPGVPGSHLIESPVKMTYNRVNRVNKEKSENNSKSYSNTPQPNGDFRNFKKNISPQYEFPDPFKHDPITNPIGNLKSDVFRGHRIFKKPPSLSANIFPVNLSFNKN